MNYPSIVLVIASLCTLLLGPEAWRLTNSRSLFLNTVAGSGGFQSRRVPIFGFNQSRDDLCDSVPGRYAVRWVAIGGSLAEPQGTAAGITFDLNAHKCGDRIVRKFYGLLDLTAPGRFSEREPAQLQLTYHRADSSQTFFRPTRIIRKTN